MGWNDQFKVAIPLPERAAYLTDLQALIASLRGDQEPLITERLRRHPDLALDYMDEGDRKERARGALKQ